MGLKSYKRHSAGVTRTRRWKAVRMFALERDGWQCVQCGTRHRLEVDHIKPVRDWPELSYSLGNLQTLCGSCHARKTRIEIGLGPLNPAREAWKKLVRETHLNPIEQRNRNA